MENNQQSFWQFSDQLRRHTSSLANLSLNDSIWSNSHVSKRPDERRNFDVRVGGDVNSVINPKSKESGLNDGFNDGWKIGSSGGAATDLNGFNDGWKIGYSANSYGLGPIGQVGNKKKGEEDHGGKIGKKNTNKKNNGDSNNNNDGLPPRYRDSVRAITPGLPLFLYNYSTHQLHGIFEAASFGGTNIDPTAWEDKKCSGESRFPAQVRVVTRKIYEPLEEDSFRPILHHYDGPKFRLELNIPEALSLLDIFEEQNP
ncbi:hypothetical protein GH714_011149 [Hevea brasiliensis]|uniref:DCD domain-containing protein n=1 Tax=Hevea brasiliensis TaxID=3981 RepID=A0A6A6MIC8_HEVBR|nr:hypothetical protein GH714_011149 [Hevea brasiliensis]